MLRTRLLVLALATSSAMAQTAQTDLDRVFSIGKSSNKAFQTLNTFTHKFGPRLTGSPNLAKAQQWAMKKFKADGLKNVHLEKWGEVPVGFARGKNQVVRMLSPWPTEMVFSTPAWTPGTKGRIEVEPVLLPKTVEEFEQRKQDLAGKWIVMDRVTGVRGPQGDASEVEKLLANVAIGGKIYGTADERVHTGGRFTGLTMETLPKIPEVRVRRSDFRTILAGISRGNCKLELHIDNEFIPGPVPQYNVVADIPGSEKPDEFVIVCGHFDSWNGPGSLGANDNGTGSSVTFESARILAKAKVKPKRTIRFILWSGEEQGLLGSRGYVESHKAEMDKVSAVFNDDGGTNYQGGYVGLEGMRSVLEAAMAPSQKAFPSLPMEFRAVAEMPRFGSSDHAPFVWAGVPGFFAIESGRADYGFVWHTQNDRPEHSIAEYLVQSSTNAASVALQVANAPELLMRVPIQAQTLTIQAPPVGAARHYFPFGEEPHGGDHSSHDHGDDYAEYMFDVFNRVARAFR